MYHIIKSSIQLSKAFSSAKEEQGTRQQRIKQACSYATTDYGAAFGDYIGKFAMNS